MQYWNIDQLDPSTEKSTPRDPGPNAPRVPSKDAGIPQVLFAHPECRAIVVPLDAGATMGDHSVRERAVVTVLWGRADIECGGEVITATKDTVLCFDPGERHSVHAHENTRLLLVLSTAEQSKRAHDDAHLPANATARAHESS